MFTFLKRWRGALFGVAISMGAVLFFVTQINLAEMRTALAEARLGWVIPSVLAIVAGLVLRAARWRVLLASPLPFMRAFHILNIAYFANAVLPLRLGELARAYLASRGETGIAPMRALSTVLVERLLDLLAVLILLALALAFAPLPDVLRRSALLFVPLTAIGFGLLVGLAANRPLAERLITWLSAHLAVAKRFDVAGLAGHFLDGLMPLIRPRLLFWAVFWTGIAWLFSVLSGYVLMLAFFPQADLGATLLFTAAASFAVAVPAVPGNLGTYEASVWVGLAAMGYGEPLASATAFAITIHGLNVLVNALLGGWGLLAEGVSVGQLTRGVRAMNTPT